MGVSMALYGFLLPSLFFFGDYNVLAYTITKGFNFSPVALHANIIVKHSLAFLTVASQIVDFQFAESHIAESN